jgi:transposase, IS30 family
MASHLTVEQRQLARRLHARGLPLREIGRQVGCSHEVIRTVVRRESKRPVRSQPWQAGPGRLGLADREEISRGTVAATTNLARQTGIGLGPALATAIWAATGGHSGAGDGSPPERWDVG